MLRSMGEVGKHCPYMYVHQRQISNSITHIWNPDDPFFEVCGAASINKQFFDALILV
jgi:hypothetical protein